MIIHCNLVILSLFHLLCHHVIHCKNPSSVKWFLLIVEQYIHLRQEHVWILLSLPYIQSTVSHTSNFSVLAANWGMWNFSKKREIKFQFCKWTFFPLSRKYSIEDAWSAHQLFSTSQEVKTQRKKNIQKIWQFKARWEICILSLKTKLLDHGSLNIDIFQNSCLQIVEEMLEGCLLLSESTVGA